MENQIEFDFRQEVIKKAKKIQGDWISFSADIYAIWKDKIYVDYGYENFESYMVGDLGMLPSLGKNIMKNYFYLENDHTHLTQPKAIEKHKLPTVEAVTFLRNQKNKIGKKISNEHYEKLQEVGISNAEPVKKVKNMYKDFVEEFDNRSVEEKYIEERKKLLDSYLKTLDKISTLLENSKVKSGLEKYAIEEDTKAMTKKLKLAKVEEVKGFVVDELNCMIGFKV